MRVDLLAGPQPGAPDVAAADAPQANAPCPLTFAFTGSGLASGVDWIVRDIASRIFMHD